MVCGPAGVGKTSFAKLFLKKFDFKRTREMLKARSNILIINSSLDKTNEPFQSMCMTPQSTSAIEEYSVTKSIDG